MAISQQQRTDLLTLLVGMFDAAPASDILDDLANGIDNGNTIAQYAANLVESSEFTGIYSRALTAEEFATSFIANLLGDTVSAETTTEAEAYVAGRLNAGASRDTVIIEALNALSAVSEDDLTWGTAVAQLNNKVEVAEYFGTQSSFSGLSLAQMQAALNGVTSDDATVTAKKAAIDSGNLEGVGSEGQTFTLTAGADTVSGTSANDTINALTINSTGATAETFSAFDSIDGGAGEDTLNIYTTNTENEAFPSSTTVKNVEVVNVYNGGTAAAALGDASKFAGVTELWQHVLATDVTNLEATTTAGFKAVEATVAADVDVTAVASATSATIALDGVKGAAATAGAETENQAAISVDGAALTAVNVSGSLAQKTTTTGAAAASLALDVTVAKDAQTATVNSGVTTTLTVENAAGSTKNLTTVDASTSTGALTYTGADAQVSTIKTGSGNDTATIATATLKDNAATTDVDETVSALLETGAGDDTITINTSGTGTTTVNAGEGNDTVTLNADGSGILTVNLGAGNDTFKTSGTGAVTGTDVIDGGEGTDTLLLNIVGAANIGAFSNFEVFDAAALNKTLDTDILAAKNTVTEFIASGDVQTGATAAVLTNVGAGVGFRVTGDMDTDALTLTQKTAGEMTITLDIDETADADSGAATNVSGAAIASNATALTAVFDADFFAAAQDATDNLTSLTITGTKATSLEVVSGGNEASNSLTYLSGDDATAGKGDVLTTVTVSGAQDLNFSITEVDASEVTSIDASALTGDLTMSTAELKAESAANKFDGGALTLGSGDDVITITQGAKISGIEAGTAEDAASQSMFDVITTGSTAQQAADVAATATLTIKDGLFTFNGTGPATLDAAIAAVDTQLTADGDAVVFEYIGNSYVFVNNDTTSDVVVQLTGVTGLTGLDTVGTSDNLYVIA